MSPNNPHRFASLAASFSQLDRLSRIAEAEPQALMAFAKLAEIGTKWSCEMLQKGVTLKTAVVRPFSEGSAHSVSFLPDGNIFKPVINDNLGPFWNVLLTPNAYKGHYFTEFRQVSAAVFEIDYQNGPYSRWTKAAGRLGTPQDRQSMIADLNAFRRWKVTNGGKTFVQRVAGAWKSAEGGVVMDYGGSNSFAYNYQAIVKKGSTYQIWWDMTGPSEIWVPIPAKK